MGMKASSGLFKNTRGAQQYELDIQYFASKKPEGVYSSTGHVSPKSISKNRDYYYGKSAEEIAEDMEKLGYETSIRVSSRRRSKAKIIVVVNYDKHRNITQVQVSPGSKRHGDIPYVKIGTTQSGKFKVIDGKQSGYKTDGKEKAKLFFRRKQK